MCNASKTNDNISKLAIKILYQKVPHAYKLQFLSLLAQKLTTIKNN